MPCGVVPSKTCRAIGRHFHHLLQHRTELERREQPSSRCRCHSPHRLPAHVLKAPPLVQHLQALTPPSPHHIVPHIHELRLPSCCSTKHNVDSCASSPVTLSLARAVVRPRCRSIRFPDSGRPYICFCMQAVCGDCPPRVWGCTKCGNAVAASQHHKNLRTNYMQ